MKNIQKTCISHNPYNVINTVIEFVGTGLGLSISKSIVEAHDENILDGKGATFRYTLRNAELGGKLQ